MDQIVVPILTSRSLCNVRMGISKYSRPEDRDPNQRRREAPFAPGFNRNIARWDAVRVDLALAFCT